MRISLQKIPLGWSCVVALGVGFLALYPFSLGYSELDATDQCIVEEPSQAQAFCLASVEIPEFSPQDLSLALLKREQRIEKIHGILKNFHTGLSSAEEWELAQLIYDESLAYQYDPELILAVIATESSFYNWSRSRVGAIGLMQIMPNTGSRLAQAKNISWLGSVTLFDPHLNVKLGIEYLSRLHYRFADLEMALTAYNYGPTRVQRMLSDGENLPKGYARRVLTHYRKFLEIKSVGTMRS